VRTEVDAEQFLKLLDLDAPEFTPILLINLGHLLQAGCTGDDLVDRRTRCGSSTGASSYKIVRARSAML